MHNTIEQEIQRLLANMDEQHEHERDTNTPQENEPAIQLAGQEDTPEIHDLYVLVVRERAEPEDPPEHVVETTLTPKKTATKEPLDTGLLATGLFYVCLALSSLVLQIFLMFNPPIATVTILPKSQTVTLSGTLPLGRILSPFTLSQSQTIPTTGRGHQDARAATGTITFFNGLFTSQTVSAGTVLTGSDGIQIATDQDATIPAANPPNFGQTTIAAHAVQTGMSGNIAAYDINTQCCLTAVKAVNTQAFTHGQDARDYRTVARGDIDTTALSLKTTLAHSMQGALTGQLVNGEALIAPICTPTATANHQPGQEATLVTVSVSQTCSAVAYNRQAVAEKTTAFLSQQAIRELGTGYNLMGQVQVSIQDATITHTPTPVFLSFHAQGTWVYAFSPETRQQIRSRIAGKTTLEVLHILLAMPGIEHAAIRFDGFGDDTTLPKTAGYIHVMLFVM